MTRTLRIGISTCPNDTFVFHALLAGEVAPDGVELAFELHDIEELNERMLAGSLDVAKVSFHAALAMAERVVVLRSGAALGFGVGPLVLAAEESPPRDRPPRVLCPGRWTTATLLWQLFHGDEPAELEQRVFAEILPALARGEADLGVCIHEGRFTWREHGLFRVEDLGQTWERSTGVPLPLGGIVASRALGADVAARVEAAIRDSLEWGLAHREACLPTMRAHAQELADDVLWAHVELYVNDWTLDLGERGRSALAALSSAARERGRRAVLGDAAGGAELAVLDAAD